MKRFPQGRIFFGVSLFLFLFLPTLSFAQTTLIRSLGLGSQGSDVVALQNYLKTGGYFTYPTSTGYFGPITQAAVAAFQKANGLEQVGSVGPLTRKLINTAFSSASSVSTPSVAGNQPSQPTPAGCNAPAGLSCVPGTNIVQPYAPSGGWTPGFGGGGGVTVVNNTAPAGDTTAPVISVISSGSPGQTTATITWSTDEAASSTISYGISTSYGTASSSVALVTSHSITLTSLTAGTLYHFQVVSEDSSGNVARSNDQTFTTATPDGAMLSAAIDSNGWTADITLKGLSSGGTYALTPNSTPNLTFNVTSPAYNSSGGATTVSRTVYGTLPLRQAYPNGTLNTESASGGNLTTTVALSDDILPSDTVTVSALSGWYAQSTSSVAVSGLVPTNNSTATEYRPIGAWVTPSNLVRNAGANMPVEFFVADRYPRNNGQVASVVFTISDGTHTATQTSSSMTQSTYLLTTTCTSTNGSAQLTSCGSTAGFIGGEFLTVAYSPYTLNAAYGGEPKVVSVDSGTSMTLNKTSTANGTVIVTVGNPTYVYAATFTNAQLNTLNAGVSTIEAVAYPNVGSIVLDTAAGADGNPIAASVITSNLKNLQFYNDRSTHYSGVYAWVSTTTAGASPAVQTSATDPGSIAYYASIKAAADAVKTYMNANNGHNDACGGHIYLKPGTTAGTGGTVSSDVPTNCGANLIIDCDPAATSGACILNAGSAGNRDVGYTTLVKNIKLTDNVSNPIVIQGPDGASTSARQSHITFQNDWFVGTQGSAFIYQTGWRQYYNSLIDQSAANCSITAPFSTTGVTNDQFGSTVLGNGSSVVTLYNSLGNVYSNAQMLGVTNASVNWIQPVSAVSAFDKLMNISSVPAFASTNDGTAHNNWAFIQDVLEAVGTTNTQTAMTFAADSDTAGLSNFLRADTTVVGNRTNFLYESKGTSPIVKTGNDLFNLDYQTNRKSDYFAADGGASGARTGSWRWRFGVGDIGDVTQGSTGGDTSASYSSWLGDFFGLTGATSAQNTNQTSFTFQSANQNSSAGGNNTGLGYYKPNTTTGLTNRVPAGFSGFPGDIEGAPRKNDGTGCTGAYECP